MLFSSWDNLFRVLVLCPAAYFGLVVLLRLSGKRTLSSMNIFDIVVTVAFGSTLATTILPSDASLADGLLSLAMLIGLQWLVARMVVTSPRVAGLVKSEPTLLLHKGDMLLEAMKRERIKQEEIMAAIRKHGLLDIAGAEAVILETDGSMSVIAEVEGPVTKDSRGDIANLPGSDRK